MKLAINRCPAHGNWSVSIDGESSGQRITPGKCCGRWEVVREWRLSADRWEEIARAAEDAAEDSMGDDDA